MGKKNNRKFRGGFLGKRGGKRGGGSGHGRHHARAPPHPLNIYKVGPDVKALATKFPELNKYLLQKRDGKATIDFKDRESLCGLAKVLLKKDFQLNIDLPSNKIFPFIQQRMNYLLWVEDILRTLPPKYKPTNVHCIDIGLGASCMYALITARKNKWNILTTESNSIVFDYATRNIKSNNLDDLVKVKKVTKNTHLSGVLDDGVIYDFFMWSPMFFNHKDALVLLGKVGQALQPKKNLQGTEFSEMLESGWEAVIVNKLMHESVHLKDRVKIFTAMMSRRSTIDKVGPELNELVGEDYKAISVFNYGPHRAWGIAWTFNKDIKLSSANCFEKLVFHDNHARKPVKYVCTNISYEEAIDQVTELLNRLKVMINVVRKTHLYYIANVTGYGETWLGKKRKSEDKLKNNSKKMKVEEKGSDYCYDANDSVESDYNDDDLDNVCGGWGGYDDDDDDDDDDGDDDDDDDNDNDSDEEDCKNDEDYDDSGNDKKKRELSINKFKKGLRSGVDQSVFTQTFLECFSSSSNSNKNALVGKAIGDNEQEPPLNAKLEVMLKDNSRSGKDIVIQMSAKGDLPLWQPVHQVMKYIQENWKKSNSHHKFQSDQRNLAQFEDSWRMPKPLPKFLDDKKTRDPPAKFQDDRRKYDPPAKFQDDRRRSDPPPRFQDKQRYDRPSNFQEERRRSDNSLQFQNDKRMRDPPAKFQDDWRRPDPPSRFQDEQRYDHPSNFQEEWRRSDPSLKFQKDKKMPDPPAKFQDERRYDHPSNFQEDWRRFDPSLQFKNDKRMPDLPAKFQNDWRKSDPSVKFQDNWKRPDPPAKFHDERRYDHTSNSQEEWRRSNPSLQFQNNERRTDLPLQFPDERRKRNPSRFQNDQRKCSPSVQFLDECRKPNSSSQNQNDWRSKPSSQFQGNWRKHDYDDYPSRSLPRGKWGGPR
ncbi:uncharacterized protein LOC142324081 [Lycorma delicatula]|uniref:uncharacterized protein LOC142324081 n=1 Tax=Lycorma delicatula TaxID=130591 RepID=UPI003F519195